MSSEDFWNSTIRNVLNRIEGFRDLETKRQQIEWERSRWLALKILSPYLERGATVKTIEVFSWEKSKQKDDTTQEKEESNEKIKSLLDEQYFNKKAKITELLNGESC